MTERWMPVPGWPGYDVSRRGVVRRTEGPLVKLTLTKGYLRAMLRANGERTFRTVHDLVLSAFVGPRPTGFHGAHLDGNPQNNAVENLAWVTPSENEAHKRLHGRDKRGERSPHARLTNEEAAIIREIFAGTATRARVAHLVGISEQAISELLLGNTYPETEG